MNVTKGDKATIICGPSAGLIVEVGEYIAPNTEVMFRGQKSFVDDAHFHWVRSLGSPIQVEVGIAMQLKSGKIIPFRKLSTMDAALDVPLPDEVLRKLVDIKDEEHEHECETV